MNLEGLANRSLGCTDCRVERHRPFSLFQDYSRGREREED